MAKRLLKRKITEMDEQGKNTPEKAESLQPPTVNDSGGHPELCPAGHIEVKDEEYWTPLVRVGSEGEQMGMIKCFGKFEVAECLIPMDINRVKKEIWKESLLMLAEHTLFDHSKKKTVVEYQSAERDFVMEKPVRKIYPVPPSASLSSKLNYRESTKISSSESDGSSASRKVREALDTHKPPLFPLIPDFSEFRQHEIEGYPLKSSNSKPIQIDSEPDKEIASDMKDLDLAQKQIGKIQPKHMKIIQLSYLVAQKGRQRGRQKQIPSWNNSGSFREQNQHPLLKAEAQTQQTMILQKFLIEKKPFLNTELIMKD